MSNERAYNLILQTVALLVVVFAGYLAWNSFHGLDEKPVSVVEKVNPAHVSKLPAMEQDAPGSKTKDFLAAPAVPTEDPILVTLRKLLEKGHAVPNEAMLTFRTKGDLAQFLRQAQKFGLRLIGTIDALHTVRVGFDDEHQLRDYLASMGANAPGLDANYWMTVPKLPKPDPTNQGGGAPVGDRLMAEINATGDRAAWGKGITVAVLDTGVKDHPTFNTGQITHVDLLQDGTPFHSHGTSVASLIAGNDERVPGVAPGANILDIRVANDKGFSVSSVLAQGIIEAVDRGAQIINISMGSYDDSVALREAVAYASQKEVFIVAAAGNDGYNELAFPAAIPSVISAGAVDAKGKQAYFSNSGSNLDITAPGVDLPTAWDSNKAASVSGTSQSAAVVTGVIAADLTLGVSHAQLLATLQKNAKVTGAPVSKVGAGIVQVSRP